MPKPKADQNGSGMHIHLSLFRDEKNIFYDKNAEFNLSKEGRYFVAGLINHAQEFFAVTNQWVNSYKRFHRGFEAPTRISWSGGDNTALIRIPRCRPEKPHSMRIELRSPDPACNPYLVLAAILSAGLKGIEEKSEIPADDGSDRFHIPENLSDALKNFETSTLMRETFGNTIMDRYIQNKHDELDKYHSYITDYELKTYLPIL
jgi:glutamine synthetase